MSCKLRIAPNGPFVVPADFCNGVAVGKVLMVGSDLRSFVWHDPTFIPVYRVSITLDVVLPNLAAQERGHTKVSTIGTALEFIVPGMPLLVDALEESMPPAVNNGMYITCRISAPAEIAFYYIGKITTKTLPYLCTVFL